MKFYKILKNKNKKLNLMQIKKSKIVNKIQMNIIIQYKIKVIH